jgi:hypothetical protein
LNTEGKRVIENSNVKLGMGEQLNIDVRNLAAGFYYIQIMDQSGSAFSGKFIKR